MSYEDPIVVRRPGSSNAGEPSFTDLAAEDETLGDLIYDGPSDQQDTLTERDRSRLGDVDTVKHLKTFLPDYAPPAADFRAGDRAEQTAFGPGTIVGTRTLDRVLFIRLDD